MIRHLLLIIALPLAATMLGGCYYTPHAYHGLSFHYSGHGHHGHHRYHGHHGRHGHHRYHHGRHHGHHRW